MMLLLLLVESVGLLYKYEDVELEFLLWLRGMLTDDDDFGYYTMSESLPKFCKQLLWSGERASYS